MDAYGFLIAVAALAVAVLAYQRLGKLDVTISRLQDEVECLKFSGRRGRRGCGRRGA